MYVIFCRFKGVQQFFIWQIPWTCVCGMQPTDAVRFFSLHRILFHFYRYCYCRIGNSLHWIFEIFTVQCVIYPPKYIYVHRFFHLFSFRFGNWYLVYWISHSSIHTNTSTIRTVSTCVHSPIHLRSNISSMFVCATCKFIFIAVQLILTNSSFLLLSFCCCWSNTFYIYSILAC